MRIKTKLIEMLAPRIVETVLANFDEATVKKHLDKWIDLIEEKIEASPTKFDDALLPVIKTIRNIFDIPDLPDVKR